MTAHTHYSPILLRLCPSLLPGRVGRKRRPALFAGTEIRVAEHIGQPVTGADLVNPVGNIVDAMFTKKARGVLGKAIMQGRQLPWHGIIEAQFLHVRTELRLLG